MLYFHNDEFQQNLFVVHKQAPYIDFITIALFEGQSTRDEIIDFRQLFDEIFDVRQLLDEILDLLIECPIFYWCFFEIFDRLTKCSISDWFVTLDSGFNSNPLVNQSINPSIKHKTHEYVLKFAWDVLSIVRSE